MRHGSVKSPHKVFADFCVQCLHPHAKGSIEKLTRRQRLLRYETGLKGYCLWNLEQGQLVICRDVVFNESSVCQSGETHVSVDDATES